MYIIYIMYIIDYLNLGYQYRLSYMQQSNQINSTIATFSKHNSVNCIIIMYHVLCIMYDLINLEMLTINYKTIDH